MRPARLAALLLTPLLASAMACAPGDDRPATQTIRAGAAGSYAVGADVLGTIHATLDGTERTWYVVAGTTGGNPYASALWFEREGKRVIAFGGFDTDDPPIETFENDVAAGKVSFGSYSGSVANIIVSVAEGEASARVEMPAEPGRVFNASYMPVAQAEDMLSGTYMLTSGTIDVTEVRFADGTASVQGTFRGTFAKMDRSSSVRMEDGRFEVSGIPHRDQLQ